MVWLWIIDLEGCIEDQSLHIVIPHDTFVSQVTMGLKSMEGYLKFGVGIGESPVQNFRDIYIDLWRHIYYKVICSVLKRIIFNTWSSSK